jgi:hypothetical protein
MIRWLFIRSNDASVTWSRVAWWWESRRILYNLLVLAFGLLLGVVNDHFFTGGGGGSPLVLIAFFLMVLVLINLYYTVGWLFDVLSRNSDLPIVRLIRPWLFIFVLFSTMFVQLLGWLGLFLFRYSNGYNQLN